MAIRANRYNDPSLGAAFENIASLFAPMSGSDLAGYAAADLNRGKAASELQRQDLARMFVEDESLSPDQRDRYAIGAGLINDANKGFGARDMINATTRRGQDMDFRLGTENNQRNNETARYGHDLTYRDGVFETLMKPVGEGEIRPELEDAWASFLGVPKGIAQIEGRQKPMTEDQVAGAALQQARDQGLYTAQNAADARIYDGTPVQVLGQDGQPVYSDPTTAMRDGLTAFQKTETPQLKAVVDPTGRRYSASATPDGWVDPETKQVIAGAVPYTANVQTSSPSDLSPTGALANDVINERARIQGTVGTIDKLLNVMDEAHPRGGVFNVVARGRNWIGNAQQAVKEATAALPDNLSADEAKAWADDMAQTLGASHDPAVKQAMNLYTDFIYQMARRANPRGEVGRYHLQQALDTWGLNDFLTGNDAQIRGLLANALDLAEQDWQVNEDRLAETPQFDPASIAALRGRLQTTPAPKAAPTPHPADDDSLFQKYGLQP